MKLTQKEIIEKIKNLDKIKIEIIGTWLWVSGNTYEHKDILKELGLWYSKNKESWYHNGDKRKFKIKGRYTMHQLRDKFITEEIQTA